MAAFPTLRSSSQDILKAARAKHGIRYRDQVSQTILRCGVELLVESMSEIQFLCLFAPPLSRVTSRRALLPALLRTETRKRGRKTRLSAGRPIRVLGSLSGSCWTKSQ